MAAIGLEYCEIVLYCEYLICVFVMPSSLLEHIENNRLQAWAWGKKDTHQWVQAFTKLIAESDENPAHTHILSAMINDAHFVKHAAGSFGYWSTVIMADRRDFFSAFLKELLQRPYLPSVLVADIMLYTVKNRMHDLATEFVYSNCVTPRQLQEFQMVAYAIEYSFSNTGSDVFDAIWTKGGNSVQGTKNINAALMTLTQKKVSDWNPAIVDKLLTKIKSASARKHFMGQPIHITDRLEHIIGLHEQMVMHEKLLRHTQTHTAANKVRKM